MIIIENRPNNNNNNIYLIHNNSNNNKISISLNLININNNNIMHYLHLVFTPLLQIEAPNDHLNNHILELWQNIENDIISKYI